MDTNQILLDQFIRDHAAAAIHAIENLNLEEAAAFIDTIPIELSVKVMNRMNSYKAAKCLELIDQHRTVQLIEEMDFLTGEKMIRKSNEDFRNKLLNALPAKTAAKLRQALSYKDNTVGAFMKPMSFTLKKTNSIEEAITAIKQEKGWMLSHIYVVDGQGKLEGIVKILDLLTGDHSIKLSSILIVHFPKFFADVNIESVANNPAWYEYQDLPVIDSSGRLMGSIHIKSLRESMHEESKEVPNDLIETSNALGELYRIGLTGFLQSVNK